MTRRRPGGMRLRAAAVSAVVAVLGVVLAHLLPGAATPAGAATGATPLPGAVPGQSSDGASPRRAPRQIPDTFELLEQTPWAGPTDDVSFRLSLPTLLPPDATLAVAVHQRVADRAALADLDDERLGSVLAAPDPVPVSALARSNGSVTYTLGLRDRSGGDPGRVSLSREGVYPVRLELRSPDGDPLAGITTLLIRTPEEPPTERLGVATVVTVRAPVARRPDGAVVIDDAERAALATVAGGLASRPDVPATLGANPETVEALSDSGNELDQAVLAQLVRGVAQRPVASAAYVPVDVGAFVAEGLRTQLGGQLDAGTRTLDELLVAPQLQLWLGDTSLTAEGLGELAGRGRSTVVLPEDALVPLSGTFTLARPFRLDIGTGRMLTGLVSDRRAGEHLASAPQRSAAAGAQRVLADLALLAFERPSMTRAVVLTTPAGWRPPAGFVEAYLDGLATSPLLAPMTVEQVVAQIPYALGDDGELVRTLEPRPPGNLGAYPEALVATEDRLAGLASAVGASNPRVDALATLLLVSGDQRLEPAQRWAYVDAVQAGIDAELAGVGPPRQQSVTLTAAEGEIPLTFTNSSGRPITLRVTLDSDKLEFPDGATQDVTLDRENTTVLFRVRARASGTFPLQLLVTSPDGRLAVTDSRMTVRSTAVSGLGVVISAGAGLFLAVWWVLHVRARRRKRPFARPSAGRRASSPPTVVTTG